MNRDDWDRRYSVTELIWTAEQVARELAGLDVEEADLGLRPVETEDGEATAIDGLVRATRPGSPR